MPSSTILFGEEAKQISFYLLKIQIVKQGHYFDGYWFYGNSAVGNLNYFPHSSSICFFAHIQRKECMDTGIFVCKIKDEFKAYSIISKHIQFEVLVQMISSHTKPIQLVNLNLDSEEKNFEADDESDPNSCDDEIEAQFEQKIDDSSSSEDDQDSQTDDQFNTLQDLIGKLNEDDHSEDEGIQDYKVGGYHPCHIGEVLMNRYVLIQKLGWGHFSTVWLAKDFKYSTYVAVKIMKSAPHYLEASYDEIEILQKVAKNAFNEQWIKALREYEPLKKKYDRDDSHVLNLLNAFLFKGPYGNHFCMVFQILGINLWQVLKKYDYKGLPINVVKEITRQVLMGLDFLNRICRVIHTDLKPENVLLCLTEQQLRKIVENQQLSSAGDFHDRLNFYCEKYGLGPVVPKNHQQPHPQQSIPSENDEKQLIFQIPEDLKTFDLKIAEVKEKIETAQSLNYKKTLKKKLKKYEEDRQLQLAKFQIYKKEQIAKRPQKANPKNEQNVQQVEHKSISQLFMNFKHKISFDNIQGGITQNCKVKIADLGNACWQHHHFATEIQTRQYRSPEVILGSKYNLTADMWSLACMTFQLLTGELLFNPKKDNSSSFGKNDDHLAQTMELLGRFPKKMSMRGAKAKKYINSKGSLNRIPRLQNWSLKDIMIAKYRFKENEALLFQEFMLPMLNCYPQRRQLSHDLLKHHWLYTRTPQHYLMNHQSHARLRAERYDINEQREEIYQYQSQEEDAQVEDNIQNGQEDEFFASEKVGDIRLIDRSFTDLGYIGYGTGIFLEKLDFGPNWQFS